MMRKIILYAGGVVNLLLAVGHMFFWKLLNWGEELPRLSPINQGVLQLANIIIIFTILYFSVMSFVMARRKVVDIFGKSLIIQIAGFYALRLFLGYPFFGFNGEELVIWLICLLLTSGYLSLVFLKEEW